jgi:hypothetical protein
MKKILKWLDDRILKISVMFLIAFIPLYPKFPLFDLKHTWVYIRLDDLAIAIVTFIFGIQLLRKKAVLKTPLTLPIGLYWIAGLATTVFSLLFVVGHIPHAYSSLVILHFLRRIEYMVVFFIAFNSVKSKKDILHYLAILCFTVLVVVIYALGQRLAGFPAILTMNEEFAKGKFLYLPPTARLTATFAGHYDLAAYMVLVIPVIVSMIFAVKRFSSKVLLVFLGSAAYIILLFTESRVSIAAYFAAVTFALWFIRKRLLIIPILLLSLLMMNKLSGSQERFYKTFRVREVAFNLDTGKPVAAIEKIDKKTKTAIAESQEITKEELPVGTGFIGIPTSGGGAGSSTTQQPKTRKEKVKRYLTEVRRLQFKTYATQELAATDEAKIATVSGKFLIRKALVYDMSFTTRFQGEWPRALAAFKGNRILGRGFSTISLATDNDYIRMIGESGILGLFTFGLIFFTLAAFVARAQRHTKSRVEKYFALGTAGGLIGLSLNAVLIDIFEASKVAYTLWILAGLSLAGLYLHYKKNVNLARELKIFITSTPIISLMLVIFGIAFFAPLLNNYFTGDDYTWLRWAADSGFEDIVLFFVKADGFFYRPLQKILYLVLFNVFWLVPKGYHMVSLSLHIVTAIGVFLLAMQIYNRKLQALLSAIIFLFLTVSSESIFWVSSLGNQLAVLFSTWSIYLYINGRVNSKISLLFISFIATVFAMLSYEGGIYVPIVILLWELLRNKKARKMLITAPYVLLVPAYISLRNFAGAHGLSGDYNYNIFKLPANIVGNLAGYISMLLVGPRLAQPWFETLRFIMKTNIALFILFSALLFVPVIFLLVISVKRKLFSKNFVFLAGYIFISLLPFLGLGNISIRYSYLAAPSFAILFGFLIRQLYLKTKKFGRIASIAIASLTFALLVIYNMARLKQASRDWVFAGNVAKSAIVSLKLEFFPLYDEANFFFVKTPIRHGLAWIFPVGLQDAIWHTFRNPWIKAYNVDNVGEAFRQSEGMNKVRIFIFNNYKLERVSKETVEFDKEFIIEKEEEIEVPIEQ